MTVMPMMASYVDCPISLHTLLTLAKLPPLPQHQSDKSLQGSSPNGTNNGHLDKSIQDKGRPTFCVDLAEQMTRDNVEVPPIMHKCCEAIEKYGICSMGIYRISGTTSKVANLRQRLDKGTMLGMRVEFQLTIFKISSRLTLTPLNGREISTMLQVF